MSSLSIFKSLLEARQQKIKEMEARFEPTLRVEQYKTTSMDVIKADYIKVVSKAIDGDQAKMDSIKAAYLKSVPSLDKQAQRVSVKGIEYRSKSLKQLQAEARSQQELPAGLHDSLEVRLLASELRNRGDQDTSDQLATWMEGIHIDMPYIHDPGYKELDTRIQKFLVYEQQAIAGELLILSDNPNQISKDDIITIAAKPEYRPDTIVPASRAGGVS